jgi:hypothetical protein
MNVNVPIRCLMGVLLLAATVGSAAARADDGHTGQTHFTKRDVTGSYGFSCSGTIVAPAALPPTFLGPFAQVGQVYCDGKETCAGTATASFNGIILSAELTGTFTVNSNGTGHITYDLTIVGDPAGQLPIDFVLTDNGRGIKGLPTSSGYAVTCDLTGQ